MYPNKLKQFSVVALSMLLCATTISQKTAYAQTNTITICDADYYWEETLTIESNKVATFSTRSTEQTKTATKTYRLKNTSSGIVLATYTLKGTFSYGTGAPAKCTSAKYTTSTSSSKTSFSAKAAYASNNQAIGTFTLRNNTGLETEIVSKTLKITCSVNGDIS